MKIKIKNLALVLLLFHGVDSFLLYLDDTETNGMWDRGEERSAEQVLPTPRIRVDYSTLEKNYQRAEEELRGRDEIDREFLGRTHKELEENITAAIRDFDSLYSESPDFPANTSFQVSLASGKRYEAMYRSNELILSMNTLMHCEDSYLRGLIIHELTHGEDDYYDKSPSIERFLELRDSLSDRTSDAIPEKDLKTLNEEVKAIFTGNNELEAFVRECRESEKRAYKNQIDYMERTLISADLDTLERMRLIFMIEERKKDYDSPNILFGEEFPDPEH